MKKSLLLFILISLSYCSVTNAQFLNNRVPIQVSEGLFFPGKILIKVKPQFRAACRNTKVDLAILNESLSKIATSNIKKKFHNHQQPTLDRNEQGYKMIDLSTIYEVEFNPDFSTEKAINILMASGNLEYAEPVYQMQLLFNPNDPDTASQYYLGLIKAFEAWDISQGDSNFVVGVTDTGTDLDHPDLANGIAYNYADPINGVDDDFDGYVDNFMGWDVGQNDNDPSVDVIHGSFVSGLAGAVTDNGLGIAAAGFKTRYLPVKISNNGVLTAAYDGIVYAADHGCQIINCSWGGFGGGQFGQDIVDYATFNKNALVVGASGNSNNEAPFFPASYKNVLSVTATNATDTKWVNSSYGAFVDISAPGEAIYSTTFDNAYLVSSGTSFAAPVVAAAAALIKTQFAFYTPLQIAEQLRATADDIYAVPGNANYVNKLGKGRLNMFRALTESPKSVRMEDYIITDNNDDAFAGNDTLDITTYLKNYLAPLNNLNVTLTSDNPDINIINGSITPGFMNTLASYNNSTSPFKAVIGTNIPFNTKVTFTLTFTDGTYTDWQIFDLVVNVDYINVQVNDVGTSITSKGRIGYNISQAQGIGFTYNDGPSFWYEGGLLVGTDTNKVSNHIFGAPVSTMADDFFSMINVRKIIPTVYSDFDLDSKFNDDGAGGNKLDIDVHQRTFAWSSPADAKYIVVEYNITNTGAALLTDLFAGIYSDWDIGNVVDNRAEYDAGLKMGYAFNTSSTPVIYAAIKQLSPGNNNYFALDNDGAGSSLNIYDGFTKPEKYQALSASRIASGQSGAGNDISMLLSSGPHSIPAGDSIKVAFAILAGDDLNSILASAAAADIKYATLNSIIQLPAFVTALSQNFPNPFANSTTINYSVGGKEKVVIEVYDVLGNIVRTLVDQTLQSGSYSVNFSASGLADGVYYCRMISGDINQVVRMIKMD
ncbi:MAG: S8 family serine peptidase [Bacteroidetes bacterium]|nr:S8 family serine peptidase [Bacteroidota bacterium]